MKPVYQDKFGNKEGNCLQACVASILELSLEQVPNFCAEPNGRWYEVFEQWLNERGMTCLILTNAKVVFMRPKGVYYIGSGISPRGFSHATVWHEGEMVHDPHPDGGGIDELMELKFLLPLDLTGLLNFLEPACKVSNEIANRWPCPFKKDLCQEYQSKLWRIIKKIDEAKR